MPHGCRPWIEPDLKKCPVKTDDGCTDFPLVKAFASDAARSTLEGGLSSRLRARSNPLPPNMAEQVVSVYERQRDQKGLSAIAEHYYEALPFVTKIDRDRKATYLRLLNERRAEADGAAGVLNGAIAALQPQIRSGCVSPRRWPALGRTRRCN